MPRQKPDDKIEMLHRQQAELAAKLKEAKAEMRAQKRDEEQLRERLAGRCLLDQIDERPDSDTSKLLLAMLDAFLKRPADRALFPALSAFASTDGSSRDEQTAAASKPLIEE